MASSSPSPDLFDQTSVLSLFSSVFIVLAAYSASRVALAPNSSGKTRFLFIWHLADALCHFILEGSLLYLFFFAYKDSKDSSIPNTHPTTQHGPLETPFFPTPYNYLGHGDSRIYGPQSAPEGDPLGAFWMVYARADRRWAGIDLGVVSLELLTVFLGTPLAIYICTLLAKKDPRAHVWMIVLATGEIYGCWMTFCPEWLIGSINLDTSNFMFKWVYLTFMNGLWVVIPAWIIKNAFTEITSAFAAQQAKKAR